MDPPYAVCLTEFVTYLSVAELLNVYIIILYSLILFLIFMSKEPAL